MSDFIHCYGIGAMHTPCLVRKHCQHYTQLRDAHFHIPIETRWHLCQDHGEHFLAIEKADDQRPQINHERASVLYKGRGRDCGGGISERRLSK